MNNLSFWMWYLIAAVCGGPILYKLFGTDTTALLVASGIYFVVVIILLNKWKSRRNARKSESDV
ncbi:hypothetical protein CEF21_21255 [Bacillus sp. FJAT-42376]|uniref:hypothetical protein n=1 Tax=Bacillus sp. FJAT-42376 TaxID=2014076 RepID=UPI000F4ECCC9|nr:hypothetical protein [Bacillus sp. FJAT-42376]AZB44610.1 hypothetical protein CEF21_21255 [Bacillus sp. FJAT-42376]